MKKLFLNATVVLFLIASACALPLTAIIFQQSAKLAGEVAAWNKQCGSKPIYDDACMKKRYKISGELGEFVALINNELDALRDVSPNAVSDPEFVGRRKIMELEVRNALYTIRCLGMPGSDAQCSAESATIDKDKVALEAEYKETHARFDGNWISLRATISPAPKGKK